MVLFRAARPAVVVAGLALSFAAQARPWTNAGLVGVGRLSANSFDQRGPGLDTLGGIFSSMALKPGSLSYSNGVYTGELLALPDRGFGDGATDFKARVQTLAFNFTPATGPFPTGQNQFQFSNTATTLFTYDGGTNFTGFDPSQAIGTQPQSAPGSIGGGRRSIDAEGLAITSDGGYYVSDEYGPWVYKFNAAGELQGTLAPGAHLTPKTGPAFPRPNDFRGSVAPDQGRRNNRGLEGLTVTPDGKTLVAALQSPTIQDGGAANGSRNTRILTWDIDPTSATFNQQTGEYIYELTLQGNAAGARHTPISEISALSNTEFLVLERDGTGLGATTTGPITYKNINVMNITGATNLLTDPVGAPYILERGAPGQLNLANSGLPAGITPVSRVDLVDMLDISQLSKFGLNVNQFGSQDQNTISEKWEGLAIIDAIDTAYAGDFYLLVGNDNDFKASTVVHNGAVVGANAVTVDNMILVYHIIPSPGAALTMGVGALAGLRRRR